MKIEVTESERDDIVRMLEEGVEVRLDSARGSARMADGDPENATRHKRISDSLYAYAAKLSALASRIEDIP